jgi:hypothetical protein
MISIHKHLYARSKRTLSPAIPVLFLILRGGSGFGIYQNRLLTIFLFQRDAMAKYFDAGPEGPDLED